MLKIDFSVFPELETERLILRRTCLNDVNELFALRSDASVMQYIPRPLSANLEEAAEHIRIMDEKINGNELINWAVTLKGQSEMIGTIGYYRIKPDHYRAEVGYMLLPDFQGKGYISEAVAKVVDYGFHHMKLHSVEAVIDPENTASAGVLLKCGFVKEAHFKENEYYNGKFLDTAVYSKLKDK